jgi:hypothetical protein
MSQNNHVHEHEFEPTYGLPERLPMGEHIIWQGSPQLGLLANSAFHFKKLVLYFAVLLVAAAWTPLTANAGVLAIFDATKWVILISLIGLSTVWGLCWLTAQTTVYTLTNKRLVMRLGIVLTVTFNLPLKQIAAANILLLDKSFGNISLALKGSDRIAWLNLWPSVRPWRISNPEPTLRAVANVEELATQLQQAWSQVNGEEAKPMQAPSAEEVDMSHLQIKLI